MSLLHKFVKIKSIEQIKEEGLVPLESYTYWAPWAPTGRTAIDVPENVVSGMVPFFGDGKIYYVSETGSSYKYLDPRTGNAKTIRTLHLYATELNENGQLTRLYHSEGAISCCSWWPEWLEEVPAPERYWPYSIGDNVYVDAIKLASEIGNNATLFHRAVCTVVARYEESMRLVVESPSGQIVKIPPSFILGLVSEMDPPEPENLYVYRCSRCGNRFFSGQELEGDGRGDVLCPQCRLRFFVTPYHRYSPPLSFWSVDDADKEEELYYGFELEIDGGGEDNEVAEHVVRHLNPDPTNPDHLWFLYCSHDGSLSEGMELISMPATLAYHHSQREKYKELFKWLKEQNYLSHNTFTCGLHFHFSRAFYEGYRKGKSNTTKLLYLVERFWDEIVIFARRDYKSLARYAKKMDRDPDDFFNRWNKREGHDGHYYSVNISNPNTIELRMFRGTLNIDTFFATLDFVDSLVHKAKDLSLGELQQLQFTDLLPESAKPYYESRLRMSQFED